MSRRLPPAADRSEANRTTLKALVKLETNKSCADCKRNKHPRWASWNLGVFVCIRCSGIHRGLGTHISRVKSVDLDTWTDEQLQSMVRWGNARANLYWEHKLAEGHVPNESKIENFIRTKYDSRRWTMEGPMPEPEALGGEGEGTADDDVPLNVVQEKARERAASGRAVSAGNNGGVLPRPPGAAMPQPQMNLFDDEPAAAVARPNTTAPEMSRPGQPKVLPKQTKPGESLLGLDFFGGSQSAPPARPSSTGVGTPGVPGRSDLKQSILSLYASKPATPAAQPAANAFGGMQSSSAHQSNAEALGGMGDAFGSLSFSPQQPTQSTPFSNFSPPAGHARQPSANKSTALSGGSFFDAKPAPPPKPASPQASNSFADFGDFSSAASPPPPPAASTSASQRPPQTTSSMGDLFDISAPAPPPKASGPAAAPSYAANSAFNLSAAQPTPAPPKPVSASTFSNLSNMDAWGSNDAWATPDSPAASRAAPPPSTTTATYKSTPAPPAVTAGGFDSGWGEVAQPKVSAPAAPAPVASGGGFSVQQDEEFGGWSHASPVASGPAGGTKQGGGGVGGEEDLFGNVWG